MSGSSPPRGLSLEYKLPLLLSGLFLLLGVGGSFLAYTQVRNSALETGTEKVERVSRQLAELIDAAVVARLAGMEAAAADPSVAAVLAGAAPPEAEAAPEVLRNMVASDGTELVELWAPSGKVLLTLGAPPTGWSAAQKDSARRIARIPREGGYSEIVTVGDARYVWAVRSVERAGGGEILGTVAQLRPVGAYSTDRQIRELIGPGTQIYFVNHGDGPWITLGGDPIPAPLAAPPFTPRTYRHPDGTEHLGHASVVEAGNFSIAAELPMSQVLARAHALAARLAGGGLVLMLLGMTGGWAVSRSITSPLRALDGAARDIAAGDYSRRVSLERGDELGKLARAFNTMAAEVEAAHEQLRVRYEEMREMARAIEENRRRLAESVELIQEARTAAEDANRAKTNFIAMLSHEIRTPVNAIVGYAELLQLGIPAPLTDEQKKQVERVQSNGRQVVAMLDELLDLARVESGQLRLASGVERVEFVVEDALATVAPDAESKGIRLQRADADEPGMEFTGDPKRVKQILLNLLSNAIKFTDSGGLVEVRTGTERASDACPTWSLITVRDTGVGIAPEDLERIFEPFVQAGYTSGANGVGLGLAISRRLARMMGGEIAVSSERGRGSVFTLRLPAAPGGTSSEPSPSPGRMEPRPKAPRRHERREGHAQQ